MKQRINLYLTVPKHLVIQLPSRLMFIISCFFFGLLLVFFGYSYLQNRSLIRMTRELERGKQVATKRIVQLSKKYAEDPEMVMLTKRVSFLTREEKIKSHVLKVLKEPASFGFSQYFEALSQQIIPDVWLIRIDILRGGKSIVLTGRAYKLEMITKFMQGLEKAPVFADRQFKLAKVEEAATSGDAARVGKDQKLLSFIINIQEGIAE